MLTAKTRVAPIKSVCVPRLELCAALLEANLVEAVTNSFSDEGFQLRRFLRGQFLWLQLPGYKIIRGNGKHLSPSE